MTDRRGGFTLVELMAAFVLVIVVAVFIVGSSRVSAASARRASLELRAAQLTLEETQHLRALAYDSLVDGSAASAAGTATWTVVDSGSYKRAELVLSTYPLQGAVIVDTVWVYRTP